MAGNDEQTRAIFLAAIEKHTPAQWPVFLDSACGGDAELRARVEQLLKAHVELGSIHPGAAPGATIDAPIPEGPGTVIGHYKLLKEIGEGGMGTVWMAQQTEPVKRLVAVKLIKAGMDSRQVIVRFEAERQALALMDHANIAKVLDGGTTSAGRPYFVMDLVRGVPITKYCDEHKLTPRQRLELFLPVCQAVQHAHQKGVIHRDLKPSNVLVALYDDKPVPKVIDFGVAKAAGQPLTDKTLVTGFGNIIGTFEYMSPEQAEVNQLDIDTRSDIYSLGVLLYELLAGSPPFTRRDLEKAGMMEMLRVIREQEPSKPSTKLSTADGLPTLAANRGTEPAKLTKLVRGELDWIVMKALEKDRNRRYETANGFAMDVQRYLADEAVQACPPSLGYRLRKFVRRNRVALVTASLVALALVIGAAISVWQAVRATSAEGLAKAEARRANEEAERATREAARANREAAKAVTEAAIAKAVNDFVNEDLLAQASPFNEPDRNIKLRTLVERAAEKVEGRFHDQPLVEAAIRQTLGFIYASLGDPRKAEAQHRRAYEIRRRDLGPEHTDTLWSMTVFASAINHQGRHAEAEKLQREALEIKVRLWGAEHPSTLISLTRLANSIAGQGRLAEAEKLQREVYKTRCRVLGPEHPDTLISRNHIASALRRQGRSADAEKILHEVLEIRRRVQRPEHPDILASMTFLAGVLCDQDRLSEAEELHRQVYEIRRRVLGPQHPGTLNSLNFLSAVQQRQGRYEEAEPVWEAALMHARQGGELAGAGRHEEAAESYRQAIATLQNLADEFPKPPKYREQVGTCYLWLIYATQDAKERRSVLRLALPLWEKLVADFPKTAGNWSALGEVHAHLGQCRKAVDLQTKAIELDAEFPLAWRRRGNANASLGQWKEALADCEQAIELGAKRPEVWVAKAAVLAQLKEPERAIAALREGIDKGFRDANQLRHLEDLAPLRERDDFKKLLTELEAKQK